MLPNQVAPDGFAAKFQQAANSYFFTQIFGSLFRLDGFSLISSNVTSVSQIGAEAADPFTGRPICYSLYGKSLSGSYIVETSIGSYNPNPVRHDMLIIDGPIQNNNTSRASTTPPNQTVLNMLFNSSDDENNPGLNLNFDQFWAPGGPAARRYSPNTPSLGSGPTAFCVVSN